MSWNQVDFDCPPSPRLEGKKTARYARSSRAALPLASITSPCAHAWLVTAAGYVLGTGAEIGLSSLVFWPSSTA